MSKAIDFRNAIESPKTDNFTCLLFRLMMKADNYFFNRLTMCFPLEASMVEIYKTGEVIPLTEDSEGATVVDYEGIARMGLERAMTLTHSPLYKVLCAAVADLIADDLHDSLQQAQHSPSQEDESTVHQDQSDGQDQRLLPPHLMQTLEHGQDQADRSQS